MGGILTSGPCGLREPSAGQSSFLLSALGLMYSACLVGADVIEGQTGINSTSGLQKIADVCPGVEYLMEHVTANTTVLQVNTPSCSVDNLPHFTPHQGAVYGRCGQSDRYCRLHIEVAQGMFLRVHLKRSGHWCDSHQWETRVVDSQSYRIKCGHHSAAEQFLDTSTNHLYILHSNLPLVTIDIEPINDHNFVTEYVSARSGYVILPGQYLSNVQTFSDPRTDVKAPASDVIMVSFQVIYDFDSKRNVPCTELIYRESNTTNHTVVCVCSEGYTPPQVFLTSHLVIRTSALHVKRYLSFDGGLKILFSFQSDTDRVQKLTGGLFNCSVDHYSSFQHHLDCNLRPECQDGQDETEHCPFSSPGCQGLVASRNKCFQHVKLKTSRVSHQIATYECLKIGGRLASIKTRNETNDFLHLFKNHETFEVLVGLTSGWYKVPLMYSTFRKWSDDTLIYNMGYELDFSYYVSRAIRTGWINSMKMTFNSRPEENIVNEMICETKSQTDDITSVRTVTVSNLFTDVAVHVHKIHNLLVCPGGHVTYTFLSCDPSSQCGQITHPHTCTVWTRRMKKDNASVLPEQNTEYTMDMFVCDDGITTAPYTLVCDFRQDCPDNSDESFCEHPACTGFVCTSSQCVLTSQRCNEYSDCLDDSDEEKCRVTYRTPNRNADKEQQLLINLEGTGFFTQQVMYRDQPCPDTHYACTADWLYCLPVYTRCNGFSDCVYGEDEQDCDTVTCPGFYRCRSSTVCVHAGNLCDGWGQCPQRDDEWSCDMTCPGGCLCQGHSFLCSNPFSANLFPQLRYVDATSSGMTISHFSNNSYLIHLSLSNCSLVNISDINLSNLQLINLANNQLKMFKMNVCLHLPNLRFLILANNPLMALASAQSHFVHYALRKLDISTTCINTLDSVLSVYLPEVTHLNLSFSAVKTIHPVGFKNIPLLTELDVRGNPVSDFPLNLLSQSNHLKRVFSSDYRFCCENLLPALSRTIRCSAPQPVVSSCTKMMAVELYRFWFWFLGACATVGNLICFLAPFALKKTFKYNFITFMTNLQSANVCMGIHVSIVSVANEMLYGEYIHLKKTWTNSVTCKLAGFLSLLSSEVSVLIIWFITLDHIIIFCFPSSRWRFSPTVTSAACGVSWCVGISLSLIPFLPGLSHWGLDGQSGLCRLAVFEDYSLKQEFKWFAVIVAFNFTLSLIIVYGQAIIWKRTPRYRIVIDSSRRSEYTAARLSVKLAATDIIGWFVFAVTSVIALNGDPASTAVSTNVAMFVLPLNSALNPLLVLWNIATQRRQEARDDRLLQMLKSRLSLPGKKALT